MGNVLENSLFFQDSEKFRDLSEKVIQFNSTYNGNNIIQDDIFSVLVNYARKNGEELGVFRFPTEDDDFCAFTCVKKGNIYVYVNSYLPLANQIFAAAHELYHIWCFIDKQDESVLRKGSLLNSASMDEEVKSREDQEANAFAGLLLVPSLALLEQMKIYGIAQNKQSIEDVIRLMAIFAVPYKAMLLRLHEDGYMDVDTVHEFLEVEPEVLQKAIAYEPDAARWYKRTPEIVQMANLRQLLDQNQEYELVSDSRAESDERTFEEILKCHKNKRG